MNKFNYDTYCGLYCGACDILMAYKGGYGDQLAAYMDVEPSQITCCGCKSDLVYINCQNCEIRMCAINKNLEHCIDCNSYPCDLFNENQLPHWKITDKNLLTIKSQGVRQWLLDQEKIWQCPDCGTGFSWYAPACSQCGKILEKIKDYNNI